jgi:hypothetical protein
MLKSRALRGSCRAQFGENRPDGAALQGHADTKLWIDLKKP